MTGVYTPRAGTIAARALAHLAGVGAAMTSGELAKALGMKTSNLGPSLEPAVSHGVLGKTGEGRKRVYFIPSAAEEPTADGPLVINHDSSGDLWFAGARQTTNGETLLSAMQLQQLVDYATTPPVRLKVASAEASS